jgi:hypothetical protein
VTWHTPKTRKPHHGRKPKSAVRRPRKTTTAVHRKPAARRPATGHTTHAQVLTAIAAHHAAALASGTARPPKARPLHLRAARVKARRPLHPKVARTRARRPTLHAVRLKARRPR